MDENGVVLCSLKELESKSLLSYSILSRTFEKLINYNLASKELITIKPNNRRNKYTILQGRTDYEILLDSLDDEDDDEDILNNLNEDDDEFLDDGVEENNEKAIFSCKNVSYGLNVMFVVFLIAYITKRKFFNK